MPVFVKASMRAKAYVRRSSIFKGVFVSNKPGEVQFRIDKLRGKVANQFLTRYGKISMKRKGQLNKLQQSLTHMRNNLYRG